MKYTDEMIEEMKSLKTFTYNSAKTFADKHDISFRSVIGKIRALELDYQPKDPKAQKVSKARGRAKSDIVNAIQTNLQTELASLSKMTIHDLEILEFALNERAVA